MQERFTRTLSFGMKGKDIENLKYHLNAIGLQNFFYEGKTSVQKTKLPYLGGSDNFDNQTLNRVKEFQRLNNLLPDELVGKKTFAVINKWLDVLRKGGLKGI